MDKNFEEIIKAKVGKRASEVPSGAWEAVSSGIGASTASGGFLASILGKIVAGSILTAAIVTGIIIGTQENEKPTANLLTSVKANPELNETPKTSEDNSGYEPSIESVVKKYTNEELMPADAGLETEKPVENNTTWEIHSANSPSSSDRSVTSDKELNSEVSNLEGSPNFQKEKLTSPAAESKVDEALTDKLTDRNHTPEEFVSADVSAPDKIIQRREGESKIHSYTINNDEITTTVKWYINEEYISDQKNLRYEFGASGRYTIMALISAENKEPYSLFKETEILPETTIQVPNVFSPQSSSGFNDLFDIDHDASQNINWYEIIILGPEGILFQSTEEVKGWDGKHKGIMVKPGIYKYRINYTTGTGITKSKLGEVSLLR